MKTVGSMLKNARLAKDVTLADVEKVTKIRVKFLDAIENDVYDLLPSPIYAKGFVRNYSMYLGLDSEMVMAFFRRQTGEVKRSAILPQKSEEITAEGFRITPGRFIAIIIGVFSVLFLSYFGIQYRQLRMPPTLTITQPANESVVSEKKLDVFGFANPDATVTVNGLSVLVRSDGKFFTQLNLDPGVNTITIVGTSRFGKTKTMTLKIGLQQ